MDDLAIADFAQHLIPEAFTTPTTALRVVKVASPFRGGDGFDRWVKERIEEAKSATYSSDDKPFGMIFVEDRHGVRWEYHREPCERVEWIAGRVSREAADRYDPWLFAVELPRPEPRWLEVWDDDGVESEEVMIPPPHDRWTLQWYAEARGRGVAAVCAGLVDMDGELERGRRDATANSGLVRVWRRILRGHPTRKRHPLR